MMIVIGVTDVDSDYGSEIEDIENDAWLLLLLFLYHNQCQEIQWRNFNVTYHPLSLFVLCQVMYSLARKGK